MIKIDLLKYNTQAIGPLASIWEEGLGKRWSPEVSIEQCKQTYAMHLNADNIPLTYVALDDNTPVGMCSLRENDGIPSAFGPWLGSLVVTPSHQHQGIGRLLIDSVVQKARQLGFEKLYLFTLDPTIPAYYERLGWVKIGQDHYKHHPVMVMSLVL